MSKADVYTTTGGKNGSVDLPDHLFALPWSESLVHQVVTGIAHNRRSGTAHTKGRSEVRGGGRKPWRQKGTGRARHGSIRSPLWVGGGVTFGPDKAKRYDVSINKKMRTKAFFVVLSEKLRSGSLSFIESFSLESPSTKAAVSCLKDLCGTSADKEKNVCTFVFADSDAAARKSFSNISGVSTVSLDALDARDALLATRLFFVGPAESVSRLTARGSVLSGDES